MTGAVRLSERDIPDAPTSNLATPRAELRALLSLAELAWDGREVRELFALELTARRQTRSLDAHLAELGWTELGTGHSRMVLGHPRRPYVLKLGYPHVNRHEQRVSDALEGHRPHPDAWEAGEQDRAPVLQTSRTGFALTMTRAEHTLKHAVDLSRTTEQNAYLICRRFQDLGFADVSERNVGWFPAEGQNEAGWRMLDLGETKLSDLHSL